MPDFIINVLMFINKYNRRDVFQEQVVCKPGGNRWHRNLPQQNEKSKFPGK